MDRESVERLRFDRRLASRRDWVDSSDRDAYLESLPDVAEKMTTAAELEAEEEAASGEEPAAAAPEPVTSSFGGPTRFGGEGFGGEGGSFGG